MYEQTLKELEYISTAVGIPVDYTQGGGGNTSAKLSDELMAVKASGFKLKQISVSEGYVIVNYRNIKDYYDHVNLDEERDCEKESSELVKRNVVPVGGGKPLRPSVEAGFHSILKKYVIHTHSVYANILCCTKNGRETVERIFGDKDFAVIWVPYINPGFSLSVRINDEISRCMGKTGMFPQVIFMENHGLIVTADDSRECVRLHQDVNDVIRDFLSIEETFPEIEIVEVGDNTFISKTGYLNDYFRHNRINPDFFDRNALYPDQLVYLNGNAGVGTTDRKLNINARTGEIIYKTNASEARTIEETLLAFLYVLTNIQKHGLTLKTMSDKEINFISNWESEAYRKSLAKGAGK